MANDSGRKVTWGAMPITYGVIRSRKPSKYRKRATLPSPASPIVNCDECLVAWDSSDREAPRDGRACWPCRRAKR
jgi:hypothetical protein